MIFSRLAWSTAILRRFALALAFTVLALAPISAEQEHPISPRLKGLEAALVSGESGALPQFWNEVKQLGTPIIEPIPGGSGRSLVTFLWRGSPEARSVTLLSGPQFLSHYNTQFTHLSGTDLWYLTVEMPEGLRIGYVLSETSASPDSAGVAVEKQSIGSDPLNLRRSEYDPQLPPSGTAAYSIFETPNAPPEPWLRRLPNVQAGEIKTYDVTSRALKSGRKVQVYRPHMLKDSNQVAGSLYLFDGDSYLSDMHVCDVLDNLISAGKIEPVIAILISSSPGEERDRELQCDEAFSEFVCSELVPWARSRFPVSKDPTRTIVAGYSLGALEAAYIARKHPDLFGAVLAQSPSLWWQPKNVTSEASDPWIGQEYANSSGLRTRFYISLGRDEPTINDKARLFEAVLRRKGLDVRLEEIEGQHDPINWRLTLPRGLLFLLPARSAL